MGKKAKLKKLRRGLKTNPITETPTNPTKFVEQLGELGYQLDKGERSPEVPTPKIEPTL